MKRTRMMLVLTFLLALLGVGFLASAPTASAGDGTNYGQSIPKNETVIGRVPLQHQGSGAPACKQGEICPAAYVTRTSGAGAWGELVVTWDGVRNHAYMYRKGAAYGERNWTYVNIKSDNMSLADPDYGYFVSYAGPADTVPDAGFCVTAYGEMTTYGEHLSASFRGACG